MNKKTITFGLAAVLLAVTCSEAVEYLSEDFETNTLGAWTSSVGTGCSAATTGSAMNTGNYSFMSADNSPANTEVYAAYIERTFTSVGEAYVRFHVNLKTGFLSQMTGSAWNNIQLFKIAANSGKYLSVILANTTTSGNRFALMETSSWTTRIDYADTPMENKWYCIEVRVTAPVAGMTASWWVDGSTQTALTVPNLAGANWNRIGAGIYACTQSTYVATAYIDDIVVSDSYNGPAGGVVEPPVVPPVTGDEHVWLHVDGKYIRYSHASTKKDQPWVGAGVIWASVWVDWTIGGDKKPLYGGFETGAAHMKDTGTNMVRIAFSSLPFPRGWGQGLGAHGLTIAETVNYWLAPRVTALKNRQIYSVLDEHQHIPAEYNSSTTSYSPAGDLHYTDAGYKNWRDNWVYMATYFKDEPWVAGYELLNEPCGKAIVFTWFTETDLRTKLAECITAIRQVDDRHILFLPSTWYTHLKNMRLTWAAVEFKPDEPQRQAVFTFHDYADSWAVENDAPPYNWFKSELDTIQNTYNVPLWLSEFNAQQMINKPGWNDTQKKQWLTDVLNICYSRRISWSMWPPNGLDSGASDVFLARMPIFSETWIPICKAQASTAPVAGVIYPTKIVSEYPSYASIQANGSDTRVLSVTLQDNNDSVSFNSTGTPVTFTMTGPGTWNDATSAPRIAYPDVSGVASVTVRSTNQAGTISVAVTAQGLSGTTLVVNAVPSGNAVKVGPNPFNPLSSPGAKITFAALESRATVKIFTLSGKLVKQMAESGDGTVSWDGTNLDSEGIKPGLYIYSITAPGADPKTGKILIR